MIAKLGTAILWGLWLTSAPPATAQSTGVAAVAIGRTGWTVTADSVQSGNNASYVLDDNRSTFWHSETSPVLANLPHNIVMDMKSPYMVNGFTYLPRQDGMSNGNVGQHTIQTSLDGSTWTTAASGTWPNDQTLKTTFFSAKPARYVRLTAQTEASGTGNQSTSAAELTVLTNPHSTLSRQKWVVSADSQQGTINSYNATETIDGSPETYWQTQYSPSSPPLPHYFTIDQGSAVAVGGLAYLPRPPSTGPDGNIGGYQVQRSSDGSTWTTIASGTWPDNNNLKTVEFAAVSSRYIRLVALTEAGNRGPWSSASEINLLNGATQLADFVVTVDSQEIIATNNSGIEGMDGDTTTFWHTEYSGTPAPLPHYFTVDMQTTYPVHALTYLPRQDGGQNGNIGSHSIDVSTDGTTWTNVAEGAFFDDQEAKLVNFEETSARYVRLTATSEAGNRGPWSSAAEISLEFDTSYTAPSTSLGQWGHMIDFPIVPVAAALIYETGTVLTWSAEFANSFGGGSGSTLTSTYDPATGIVSELDVTNTEHDMFCPGLSVDFNGRPFVTGGNDAARTSIYDPAAGAWIFAPNMQIARGYQASQTLSDGRVFTIGGSWSGGQGNKNGEVFSMANNAWTLLPGCPVAPMLTNDNQGVYRADNHGWFFAWSNSTVLQAGPSHNMNWYSTVGYGGVKSAGTRGTDDAMNGNAVMYDAVAGNVLTAGGGTSYQLVAASAAANILTLGAPNTTVTVTPIGAMHYRRAFANGVALPDGTVFIVGGQEYPNPFYDDEAIMYPELWSPVTKAFTVLAPMVIPRTYHSVALLLPDATVFSGGGGLCGGCSQNHFDAQIFSPPYLFNTDGSLATRPVISSVAAASVLVGGTISVVTNGAVASFAMIRMGSSTHTVDTDQRRVPLLATSTGPNAYSMPVPADPGVALPGYWMLFALSSAGVPSVAKTVQVIPTVPIA